MSKFNEVTPAPEQSEPVSHWFVAHEVFKHCLVQPLKDHLCSRNDAVMLSMAGIRRDTAMEDAYAEA